MGGQFARERGLGSGGVEEGQGELLTSSLIFFQMILVISSPSSSTTGPFTAILDISEV